MEILTSDECKKCDPGDVFEPRCGSRLYIKGFKEHPFASSIVVGVQYWLEYRERRRKVDNRAYQEKGSPIHNLSKKINLFPSERNVCGRFECRENLKVRGSNEENRAGLKRRYPPISKWSVFDAAAMLALSMESYDQRGRRYLEMRVDGKMKMEPRVATRNLSRSNDAMGTFSAP